MENLLNPAEEHTSTVSAVIMACSVLHNNCIDVRDPTETDLMSDDDCDSLIGNGNVQMIASDIRDAIMEYF